MCWCCVFLNFVIVFEYMRKHFPQQRIILNGVIHLAACLPESEAYLLRLLLDDARRDVPDWGERVAFKASRVGVLQSLLCSLSATRPNF
jgi:hypothetical protein